MEDLVNIIGVNISNGRQPYGNVFISSGNVGGIDRDIYNQPMVKYEEELTVLPLPEGLNTNCVPNHKIVCLSCASHLSDDKVCKDPKCISYIEPPFKCKSCYHDGTWMNCSNETCPYFNN